MEDIPETFDNRPGTVDVGKDYEIKIAVLLSLRCINNTKIRNFWLIGNADKCGAFDDIILSIENQDCNIITYLIQLKHVMKPKALKRRELVTYKPKNKDFYLPKYYNTVKSIKQQMDAENNSKSDVMKYLDRHRNSMVYILFTTRDSCKGDHLININKGSSAENTLLLYECVNTDGEILSFNYENLNLEIEDEYRQWMDNFYLFTKQVHIKKVDAIIQDYIRKLIHPVELAKHVMDELYQKLMLLVSQWAKGELGGFYPLNKNIILNVLFECLTKSYMWNFGGNNPNTVELRSDDFFRISNSAVTVIHSDDVVKQFLVSHIYRIIEQYSEVNEHKVLWKRHPEKISKSIFRVTGRYKKITKEAAYEFLWKTKELPLLLEVKTMEDCKILFQLLGIFPEMFKVIVLAESVEHIDEKLQICSSLHHLSEGDRNFVLNYPVKLQNRPFVKLSSFVNPENFHLVTIKDIVYIFMDKFNIGGDPPSIPEIFIKQTTEPVLLRSEVLKEVSAEKFVIYCLHIGDMNVFLGKLGISLENDYILTWQPNCTNNIAENHQIILVPDSSEILNVINMTNPFITHLLKLTCKDKLEWINTFGSYQNIASYRKDIKMEDFKNYTRPMHDDFLKKMAPKINIISADPGTGKSTMLAFIANTAPTDRWILLINLIDHINYYKDYDASRNHVEYFATHCINNPLSRLIFDVHLATKKLMILFDGFDEIPFNVHKKVVKMIRDCEQLGCVVYLTTRTNMQAFLEKSFQTFARSVTLFSPRDQFEYMKRYFTQHCSDTTDTAELIDTFTNNLLKATAGNLNDQDQKFTGIPLQASLLCQVFKKDCVSYLHSQVFENKHFDLIYLYKQFISEKIKIVCDKFGKGSEDLFYHYHEYRTLFAFQSIFLKEDLESLNVDQRLNQVVILLPDILHQLQKDGIVTIRKETEVAFIHRTFAEYLVAKWLSKHCDDDDDNTGIAKNLIKKMFEPNFVTVRNMFDRLMAKRCPLHLAIINRQIAEIEMILERDKASLSHLDRGGRSVYHLVAGLGVYHPPCNIFSNNRSVISEMNSKDPMISVLKLLGKVECKKDRLLDYTPIDYAIASASLNLANVLCKQLESIDGCITLPALDTAHASSQLNIFKFGYLELALVKHTTFTELKKLEQGSFNKELHPIHHAIFNGRITAQLPCDTAAAPISTQSQIIQGLLEQGVHVDNPDNSGKTALHWAAIKGHLSVVNILLSYSADPNAADFNGMTILHYLSMRSDGDAEIIAALLERGADVSKRDKKYRTVLHYAYYYSTHKLSTQFLNNRIPLDDLLAVDVGGNSILHFAAYKGDEDIVQQLIALGVDVNITDAFQTPLHCASQEGHLDVVKCLYFNNADLKIVNISGISPLMVAVLNNKIDVVKFLLSKSVFISQTDRMGRTALYHAIERNYEPIVAALLEKAKDEDFSSREYSHVIHWAAFKGNGNIIKLLLSRKVKCTVLDEYGRTPLICASTCGNTSAVQVLLNESDVLAQDSEGMNSLHWSCYNGHTDTVRILLPHMSNIELKDNKGRTALNCCGNNDNTDIADLLFARNADVNTVDNNKMTPLNWAAHIGNYEMVKWLLQRNCALAIENHCGMTALSNSVSKGHHEIVRLLLSHPFPMEVRNSAGMNGLHTAAIHGHLDIVSSFARKGANLEATSSNCNRTALIYAAQFGHTSIVHYLINQKVQLNAADSDNMTALNWAAKRGYNGIVTLLVNNGAKKEIPNKHGETPFLSSIGNDHSDVTETLLSKGVNVHVVPNYGMPCIHQVAYLGNVKIFKMLVDKFAVDFKDTMGKTTLMHAAINGHNDLISILLEKGASICAQDDYGMTALHWACYDGYVSTVELLLSKGNSADLMDHFILKEFLCRKLNCTSVHQYNKRNFLIPLPRCGFNSGLQVVIPWILRFPNPTHGMNLLQWCCSHGYIDIVRIMLPHVLNLEEKDDYGRTALICCCQNGYTDIARILLSRGADVNTLDENEMTPLNWAAHNGHHKTVKLLLQSNCMQRIKSNSGPTVMSTSFGQCDQIIARLILASSEGGARI
uniref:Uncharacterized protein n=1 Tax=Photinus pyralis TaxID=7054 RepID=A0A1Y1NIQ2_PHOPY